MAIAANNVDRLLPRRGPKAGLELHWNLRKERAGFRKKEEVFSRAMILDVSLEGALVEVPDSQIHEIGDRIRIRFRGIDGDATIRHQRPGLDGHILYGVWFGNGVTFLTAITDAVAEMRDIDAIEAVWNRRT